ncbi:Hsp70 family protein [Desulfospira joergensenii]|uniref:Hsp70 family protein n=1 Tax=Desulfospira joergensenii TaxID=53329 RepID=UPI0003B72286|nr:Hsp70 family protein [Desulfospira joergensenii]
MLGIGLDFGTTNSTLAIFDGRTVSYIAIDDEDGYDVVMPTANYMDRDYTATVGTEALNNYLEFNQGRQIILEEVSLGTIRVTHGESNMLRGREDNGGDTTVALDVHAKVDKNMPGLLLRGLKRWLGMGSIETIDIFGIKYNVEALITPILAHIKRRLHRSIYKKPLSIHIGRPVQFEKDTIGGNRMAIEKLGKSVRYSGLPEPEFFPEPLGAAISFMADEKPCAGERLLAFDFGGGTLDLCVIKIESNGFSIQATHGIPIGGDHINQLIYETKIFPELGKGLIVRTAHLDIVAEELFPFAKFEDGLLNWHQTHTLNHEDYLDKIDTALYSNRQDKKTIEKLTRLRELITWNYSYSVIKAIEQAKISLSEKDIALIEVPELDLSVEITKPEFKQIIVSLLDKIDGAVDRILEKSGLDEECVDHLISTGGSSLIPEVQRMLANRFPGRVKAHSEFKGIAAGLAIANYHGYKYSCD